MARRLRRCSFQGCGKKAIVLITLHGKEFVKRAFPYCLDHSDLVERMRLGEIFQAEFVSTDINDFICLLNPIVGEDDDSRT